MLTKRQHELLHFIHERIQATGMSPTYMDMRDALGLKSKSGINRLVMALEERGFVSRLKSHARSIQVLKAPSPNYKEIALYWRMKADGYLVRLKELEGAKRQESLDREHHSSV